MTLGKRQEEFMIYLPRLLDWLHENGFSVRGGSLFRDPRLHGNVGFPSIMAWLEQNHPEIAAEAEAAGYRDYGSRNSLHKQKCAVDLNLFRNGQLLSRTEDHAVAGAFWESLHPMCRWGGRYNDGNHYEFLEWR